MGNCRERAVTDARFDGKFSSGVVGSGVLLPLDLSRTTAKEKNVRYFPDCRRRCWNGFSPLSALPSGMLARNSGLGRDAKHSFASFAADR